jgi:lipoprotein NlpD
MRMYPKQSHILQNVLLSLLLQACVQNPTLAPVTTHSQTITTDNQDTVPDKTTINDNISPEPYQPPMPSTSHLKQNTQDEGVFLDRQQGNNKKINRPPSNLGENIFSAPAANFAQHIFKQTKPEEQNNFKSTIPTHAANQYHAVKKGETLYAIGSQSGYGFQHLARWNNIPVPYAVEVGQKLKLFDPNTEYAYKKYTHKHTYKVAKTHQKEKKPFISNAKSQEAYLPANTKQSPLTAAITKYQPLKKATISIDNKKMLKLAFEWPLKGAVVKNFRQSKNKGIDIAGKIGQAVCATEAGKVIYGGPWLVGFGNLLIIKHTPSYLSAYANNSQLLVKEGQKVNKGQIVAQVGRTPSRKAALHFEIRKNGKSVNPLRLLPSL